MSEDEKPFTRPGFVVAALLVAGLAVMAIVILVTSLFEDDTAQTASSPPDLGQEEGQQHAMETDSVCGLSGETSEIPDTAPEVDWEFVGTIQAPSSDTDGPGVIDDDGFRSCYAPTPTGALLAVANYAALGSDPDLQLRIPDELTADSPGRDAALEEIDEHEYNSGNTYLELRGFQITQFDAGNARIDLAFSSSNGMTFSFLTDVTWDDGDWKIEITDDGDMQFPPVQISDLSEYTALRPES